MPLKDKDKHNEKKERIQARGERRMDTKQKGKHQYTTTQKTPKTKKRQQTY